MLLVCETAVNTLGRFNSLKKTISVKSTTKELSEEDRVYYQKLLSENYVTLICVIQEFKHIHSYYIDNEMMTARVLRRSIISRIQELRTFEDIISICDMILEPFQEILEKKYFNSVETYNYSGTFDRYYVYEHGNSLLAERLVSDLRKHMNYRRPLNVFAIGSGCVEAASQLDSKDLIKLYAFDPQKCILPHFRKKFTRVIYGSLHKSYISNNVFDMVILTPPIPLSSTRVNNRPTDPIKESIVKSFNYLRPGGILGFGLPYFRYYPSVCTELSKHYDILETLTYIEAMSSHEQAYVIGKRKLVPELSQEGYKQVRQIPVNYDNLPIQLDKDIVFPEHTLIVERFRGSELSEEEQEEAFDVSFCTQKFWSEQNTEVSLSAPKRPLLPFNIGQLGLVLTSGCLDGVIDEEDGCGHIVRGRIIKKTDENEVPNAEGGQIITTTSNRVEINMFLPNGDYKSLA